MTSAARAISMGFWLPVLLISLGISMWTLMTWKDYNAQTRMLQRNSIELIRQDMSVLQHELEEELSRNNLDKVELAVKIRRNNPRYAELALVDGRMQVVFSEDDAQRGRAADEAIDEFDQRVFRRITDSKSQHTEFRQDTSRFVAYYPVALGPDGTQAGNGAAVLVYDISEDMQSIWRGVLNTGVVTAALLALTLGVFFMLHKRYVTRPIEQLIATIQSLADGNYGVLSSIRGSGEIAQLVDAVNSMSRQLQERQQQHDSVQQALQEKEQWQQHLLNTLPDGVQEINRDGVITYSNPAHHRILGLNNGELIGRNVWDFQPDEASKKEIANHLQFLLREQPQPTPYITENLTIDGRRITLEIVWDYRRDSGGETTGFIAVVSDITERVTAEKARAESERKYTTLFEKSADAILLIENHRFIDCNQAALNMLGYDNKQRLLETHPSELSPDKQPDGKASFDKANEMITMAMQQGSHRFRWIHKRANGENFPVEVLLTAIPYGENRLLHVVWRDLTEKEQIEEALRRTQKMDAIGQLTGGIAHDFNNILGIIIGNLSLLETLHKLDEKTRKRLGVIRHSTERAIELTRQLLGFSRRTSAASQTASLNDIIRQTSSLIDQSLTPQIEVEYRFAEDLWLADINTGEFEDTLINLSLNARDAMQGRGRLTIETHNSVLDDAYCQINPGVSPGQYVQLTVSDNGEGVARENLSRIFEPFYTTKEQGKGTGLGLAMVFGFVKRAGGHIKVYSETGIGTTFRIYLPRAQQNHQSHKPVEARQDLMHGEGVILVVDDEWELLALIEETLQMQGYTVYTAENAAEALQLLAQHPEVDLLFSDVVMPGEMNGYELAEQAAARHPNLKVLLTSGYTETAIARNGQARFNANLLSKPYTLHDLTRRVHYMLTGRE